MLAGELYDARAPELQMELAATHWWLVRYNAALDASTADRRELLLERLAAVGDGAVIRPPFHCDYGYNIRLGAGVFLTSTACFSMSWRSRSATSRRSGRGCRSWRPTIRATARNDPLAWSLAGRSASGTTSGS